MGPLDIYERLLAFYGPQCWWPAQTPFEVMVGAVLTQGTSWRNVEKAIYGLKSLSLLSPEAIRRMDDEELSAIIRPCGFYRVKTKRLKSLINWLGAYDDSLERLSSEETDVLRRSLLGVKGIGKETADAILLYALGRPVFVIDSYTRRIMSRLGMGPDDGSYDKLQRLFGDTLPNDPQLFNEFHALLVRLGKDACRPTPLCLRCCLVTLCSFYQSEGHLQRHS